ncbi:MAG: serine/threonine protein kinase, bacterial [Actinomycetota bacterium]|nr:serine/threonine protein kinase, bacterial [Actinomycetota bacterium]
MSLTPGEKFAGFTVVRLLGAGGMGEVYLVQHPRLPRHNALKVLPRDWAQDSEYRSRFIREADLASKLWHPHVVGVHDRGEFDGQLWISMDFVDGVDAARLLERHYPVGMPVDDVTRIITAVSGALDYAHTQDLLHRDVKPANIMLTQFDEDADQRILLTDFGIARDVNDISGLTATNMTVGTVAYSAPEQLMGEALDGRTDQYALAATAYHLLTGRHLFPHTNPAVVISRHLNSPPPPLANTRPELGTLDHALATALAKNPDDRFVRCSDFARALVDSWQAQGGVGAGTAPTAQAARAAPVPPTVSTTHAGSGAARWYGVAAITVALVVAGASFFIWRPWQEGQSASTGENSAASVSPSTRPAVPPERTTSAPPTPTTATPLVLPTEPPPNSGCGGLIVAHHDFEHPTLGPMRIFLMDDPRELGPDAGCVSAVTAGGTVLPPIPVDATSQFAFASPATDATGNIFIDYTTIRHSGVMVLVPTDDGFADMGWEYAPPHYQGRYAFHYAALSGPGADGRYAILDYTESCIPSCADGSDSSQVLTWNGSDYAP